MNKYSTQCGKLNKQIAAAFCFVVLSSFTGCGTPKKNSVEALPATQSTIPMPTIGMPKQSINDFGLPAKMALFAYGEKFKSISDSLPKNSNGLLVELFEKYKEARCSNQACSEEEIQNKFACLFQGRQSTKNFPSDNELRSQLIRLAINKTADEIGPLTLKEQEEAVRLLESGEFYQDIAGSLAAVYRVVPEVPLKLIQGLPQTVVESPEYLNALAKDILDVSNNKRVVDSFLGKLKLWDSSGKKLPKSRPKILSNTLAQVYKNPGTNGIAGVITALIAPENKSLRLAIIVYARVNGIKISNEDLDALIAGPLKTTNPDLEPLLEQAIASMEKQYGIDEAKQRLSSMSLKDNSKCENNQVQ